MDHIPYFYKMGETGVWILFLWISLKSLSKRMEQTENKFAKAHDDVIAEVRTMTSSIQGVEKSLVSHAKDLESGKDRFGNIEKKIEKMDNEVSLIKLEIVRINTDKN